MNRFLFIVALLVAAWTEPAAAYVPGWHSCQVFFGDEADLPAQAKPYFKDGEMLTICQKAFQPGQTYLIADEPDRSLRGTCLVQISRLDPETDSPGNRRAPDNYFAVLMLKTEATDCPRQDDKRYIETSQLPEGLFLATLDLLQRINKGAPNEDIFTAANLDPDCPRHLTREGGETETEADWIKKAKDARLLTVSSRRMTSPVPSILIEIGAVGRRWFLTADLFDGKLKIIDVGISSRGINE